MISITRKDESITWGEIQSFLYECHESNSKRGLIYATKNQTVERLIEKQRNSECWVALDNNKLCGTITIEKREINKYYHKGFVIYLKLLAVSPSYRGSGLSKRLIKLGEDIAKENNYNYIIIDSAEKNYALRKLVLNNGFVIIGAVKYKANNFISTIYAKSLLKESFLIQFMHRINWIWNKSKIQIKQLLNS